LLEAVLVQGNQSAATTAVLRAAAARLQSEAINAGRLALIRAAVLPVVSRLIRVPPESDAEFEAVLLATTLKIPTGAAGAQAVLVSPTTRRETRLAALNALVAARDESVIELVASILGQGKTDPPVFAGQIVSALAPLDDPRVADIV